VPTLLIPEFHPIADPRAVVSAPHVRFTVLTSRLLRLEFSPTDHFENRPSQVFWHRHQATPEFMLTRRAGHLKIRTEHLELDFLASEDGFTTENLSIRVHETGVTWHYGEWVASDNLGGTARTLDGTFGATRLEPGLNSHSGWAVVDDSESLVFNENGWATERQAEACSRDLYFFGYGHDYQGCLSDFCRVAGSIPLVPRWALGNWWSHYWSYTQDELMELAMEFERQEVPLSVWVIDMDWHLTETGNHSSGWTGYTWNRELFPDPPALLRWLHKRGLKVTLNLHPADGVYPHEEAFASMAVRLGLDPEKKQPIPFDLTDPAFTRAYFDLLHHPLERQGVDFWWIDWQQDTNARLRDFDPLWWLNHYHFMSSLRIRKKPALILSRWGGLGNHRYPLGFSGDTVVTWEALAFQPAFTATAANVGYTWWSHDIGGHMGGIEDEELFTRWVQFGVLSPIFRLHSSKSAYLERRPWMFSPDIFSNVREWMRFRYALVPYLHTMAWLTHTHGEALLRPMYYQYPEENQAYRCPNQYLFGTELIASPVVTPIEAETHLASQNVWLPKGKWYHFFSGDAFEGGGWLRWYGKVPDVPLFARAGAIVPLGPKQAVTALCPPCDLEVHLFPGDGSFELVEGDDRAQTDRAVTPLLLKHSAHGLRFEIQPVRGNARLVPTQRRYQLVFHTVAVPEQVEVWVGGEQIPVQTDYDEETESFWLGPITLFPSVRLSVRLESRSGRLFERRDRRIEHFREMLRGFHLPTEIKDRIDRELTELLKNPNLLLSFGTDLTPTQIEALQDCLAAH